MAAVRNRNPLFYKKQPGGIDQVLDVSKIPGAIFYVDSTSSGKGDTEGHGASPDAPFATIDYAIGQTVANKGDVIFVMPGHAETLGDAAIAVDVAGISVIGLGKGSAMPRITHGHANSEVTIAADGVRWQGIRHSAGITAVLKAIDIEADVDFVTVSDCLFDTIVAGTDEFNATIRLVDGNIRCTIARNIIDMGIAGAVAGIHMDADTAFTVIEDNIIRGDFSTANIVGDTTLSTNLLIRRNLLENGIGGNIGTEPGIELLTGTTGTISDNDIVCNLTTKAAAIVADTCLLFRNYYNEDISGAATGGVIGTASDND